jgi:hypothetical protein
MPDLGFRQSTGLRCTGWFLAENYFRRLRIKFHFLGKNFHKLFNPGI